MIFVVAALSLTFAACGGGPDDSPPGPLARHFDDMFIADVALDQKQSVIESQNKWSVAKMENAKAEADFNEATAQMTSVRNDLKASRLAVDTAISNKKQAEASADNNRINQAAKDLHAAEAGVKAAELRVKYLDAYRAYLKRHWRHAQESMYWLEAKYELAKSQVAQKNNKSPRGVQYDWFPKQEQERNKRTQVAKTKVDAEKQKALAARELWLKQQQTADRESGQPSSHADPMAPKGLPPAGSVPLPPAATTSPAPALPPAPTE